MENLWKMIAKARGVELNEEFKWNGFIYKINDYYGLLVLGDAWIKSKSVISFIRGGDDCVIERLPFVPKMGDEYWTYSDGANAPVIRCHYWSNDYYDKEHKLLGIVFRTEQDASDYLPIWIERINKL